MEIEGELEYEVESILLHREVKPGKMEYYVKWIGYGPEHCTWEPERNMKNSPAILDLYWKQRYVSVEKTMVNKNTPQQLRQTSIGSGMKRKSASLSMEERHTRQRVK